MPSRGRRTNVALTAFLWAGRRKQLSTGRTTVLGVERRSMETVTASLLTSACPPGENPGEALNPDLSPTLWAPGGEWELFLLFLFLSFLFLSLSFTLFLLFSPISKAWGSLQVWGVISYPSGRCDQCPAQLRPPLCPLFRFICSVETFCNICPPNSAAQGCLRNHKSQSRWWLRKHQWLTELFRANPYYWCCNNVMVCQLRAACHCSVTVQTQRLKFG